jgi:hypothetical protein
MTPEEIKNTFKIDITVKSRDFYTVAFRTFYFMSNIDNYKSYDALAKTVNMHHCTIIHAKKRHVLDLKQSKVYAKLYEGYLKKDSKTIVRAKKEKRKIKRIDMEIKNAVLKSDANKNKPFVVTKNNVVKYKMNEVLNILRHHNKHRLWKKVLPNWTYNDFRELERLRDITLNKLKVEII